MRTNLQLQALASFIIRSSSSKNQSATGLLLFLVCVSSQKEEKNPLKAELTDISKLKTELLKHFNLQIFPVPCFSESHYTT